MSKVGFLFVDETMQQNISAVLALNNSRELGFI